MAVKKNDPAEEETVEEADRPVSETVSPEETVETPESEAEAPEKAVKTPAEEEAEPKTEPEEEDPRAFQARRHAEEIKRLREELAQAKKRESAIEALSPRAPRQVLSQMPKVEQFADAEGRIDVVAYDNAIRQWTEGQAVQVREGQREQAFHMEKEFLKMKDPRLDDANKEAFDEKLEARVADRYSRLALESLYTGRAEPTLKQAYNEVLKEYGPTPKEKEKISQEALEKVSEKEQAASTSESPSTAPRAKGARMVSGFEELRKKTKEGDDEALAARLAKIPDQK